MAILFNGIVMSHYTHFNLSTVTQITMQQTMRTLAFIAETCVFAYLGLALFSFKLHFEPALVIWSLILCLIGRACNIFPLAYLCNKFREHQITKHMMFIMWFSGKSKFKNEINMNIRINYKLFLKIYLQYQISFN